MWRVGEGSLGPEIKGSGSPFGPRDPVVAGVRCSVAGRAQVGGREGLGGGRREQSGAVQSQKETAPREGAGGGHCSSSEDSCEMPSSSSFSSFFWVCPLVFSLELWWFSGSWRHPCFCSPSVGPEVS